MPGHDIIVIGASAGGVEALTYLVKNLPSDLDAAIFIVLHVPSHSTSVLPKILNRAKGLPVSHAIHGEAIFPKRIYVAPPDYHLLVKSGHIHLSRGPRENSHRPAIDPLFRSAARYYGQRVVAVILTGALDDGTAGLLAVKAQGGVAVVQHPDDAMYYGMPRSAIDNVDVDYILPLSDIPNELVNLVNIMVEGEIENPESSRIEFESEIAELNMEAVENQSRPGTPSSYSCPDCGGTLWEITENGLLRFRCRTGHAFSGESLIAKQSDALENALWIALRALEEKASLARSMAQRLHKSSSVLSANKLEQNAQDAEQSATIIRDLLLKSDDESIVESQINQDRESGNQDDHN
jgi:two-component system, chemotaxis family, protein-glutamate methylesterase/glutaminase